MADRGFGTVPTVRWRMLLPVLAAVGLLAAVAPTASAEDAYNPSAAPAAPLLSPAGRAISASSLQPAIRGPVKQIGPYIAEFPELPADSGSGRRVVYCNSCQYVWIIDEHEQVVRHYPVSGRQFVPGPGVYNIFVKQRYTFATGNPSVTWEYMVTFTHGPRGGAIGFHAIPWQYGSPVQSNAQLGMFLSAGCVRQNHEDAAFMWDWSNVGDTVVVTR